MAKIIGITGRKGSGKDTAAAALVGWTPIKFAGAIKEMLKSYLVYMGMTDSGAESMLEDPALKEMPTAFFAGYSPRYAMQTLGTEWGRSIINSNMWVVSTMVRALQYERVVITDVRFPNEVEAVQRQGGIVIRIERNAASVAPKHESEFHIDTLGVDYGIDNNGTIESLHASVQAIARIDERLK